MNKTERLLSKIRDRVGAVRALHNLFADRVKWAKICASMDVIGDTELAIHAYHDKGTSEKSSGENYLVVYCILQALFLQQDATADLAHALGVTFSLPSELKNIREIRNISVGHPTDYRRGKDISQSFISRPTVSHLGFQLYQTSSKDGDRFVGVNIPTLIVKQREEIFKILETALGHMENEEIEHRRKFRDIKLASAFRDTLNYGFEKMGDGIRNYSLRTAIGKWGFDHVIGSIEDFKRLLNERGILKAYDMSINPILKELEYPIKELNIFYSDNSIGMSDESAEVFCFYLEAKINKLREIADAIDKEYESDLIG